ncbi:MAG: toll/interleukin-1 receptor domain-containing protein [Syntrophomonas sp.]
MEKIPTAFISYSWDSQEHQVWVTSLVNILRENVVEATLDVFETQTGTVNLNQMMIRNIKDNDFTIIIMTPKYAQKADEFQGGVGFETSLLISCIQENPNKIIPVLRSKDRKSAIPFYLNGYHYIDFSDDANFDEKVRELLHRLHGVDLIEKAPLGSKPDLKPKSIGELIAPKTDDFDDLIPNLIEHTDMDKNRFMKESFVQIRDGLLQIMDRTKQQNTNFDFDFENLTSKKALLRGYVNGQQKYAVKLWLGSGFGSREETINLSYGNHVSESDNSMNEFISCEVAKDKSLLLKMNMNMFGNRAANTSYEIVREIWSEITHWLN